MRTRWLTTQPYDCLTYTGRQFPTTSLIRSGEVAADRMPDAQCIFHWTMLEVYRTEVLHRYSWEGISAMFSLFKHCANVSVYGSLRIKQRHRLILYECTWDLYTLAHAHVFSQGLSGEGQWSSHWIPLKIPKMACCYRICPQGQHWPPP